jgi:hypothetical protein
MRWAPRVVTANSAPSGWADSQHVVKAKKAEGAQANSPRTGLASKKSRERVCQRACRGRVIVDRGKGQLSGVGRGRSVSPVAARSGRRRRLETNGQRRALKGVNKAQRKHSPQVVVFARTRL